MVFIEHNSLTSDIFFNPIFFPCFSGFMLFRVQVFQSPGLFRVQVFQVFQGPGPGFRSSLFFGQDLKSSYSNKSFLLFNNMFRKK